MKLKNIFTTIFVLFLLLIPTFFAEAYVSVKGYYRNGTYVAPHVRSNPNGLKYDNYGYKPSQGLYNKTYGTKGIKWDTPTYITDPDYYIGKSLYDSGSAGSQVSSLENTDITSKEISIPHNAYKSTYSDDWYCNSGYKTIYNDSFQKVSCEKVIAPFNAYVSGSDWYCSNGYKTIYDNSFQKVSCEKVIAPSNAYVSGNSWYCNSGYKTIYDSSFEKTGCLKVIAPQNAYISGSDWYCNSGYKTIYNDSFQKVSCTNK
ncbi:MAG: hypothetical protein RLY49_546 [Candidatus Parcubacteria bacterium]|jgi:hypothetical protein